MKNKPEKSKKHLTIVTILFIIFCLACIYLISIFEAKAESVIRGNNMEATMEAVVIRVNENSLDVMGTENNYDLYRISFSNEGNIGFEQGQEVLIYYGGVISEMYPAGISDVGKIEIIKEKSDNIIPDNILRFYYSSIDNIEISIEELTNTGIRLKILDTNEFKYEYPNEYSIYIENEGTKSLLIKRSDTWSEEIVEKNINSNNEILMKTYNWENTYGKLEEGEYQLLFLISDAILSWKITVDFTINENGEISYSEPIISREY